MGARWPWVRWANVVLALLLAIVLVVWGGLVYRAIRFQFNGTSDVDGLTIYLDPDDHYLTPLAIRDGEYEAGESAEFRRLIRPGDTVIDVGANVGWYTLLSASRVGPSGCVIAFEPAPMNLAFLRKNVATNRLGNVTIEPKAVSDRRGSLTLHLHDVNHGMHSVLPGSGQSESVAVEAVSLDDYLCSVSRDIGLIKIDVEGAEGLVLAGMRQTLNERPPRTLIVEFNPGGIRGTGLDPEAVLRGVLTAGYRVREIDVMSGRSIGMDETAVLGLARRLEARRELTNLIFEREGPGPKG